MGKCWPQRVQPDCRPGGLYQKKTEGSVIFSQYGLLQDWLIIHLLVLSCLEKICHDHGKILQTLSAQF